MRRRWVLASILAAGLALAAGAFHAAALADGDYGYALVAIRNRTRQAITYSYSWGDQPMKSTTLRPGIKALHGVPYMPGHQGHSPPLHVEFTTSSGRPGVMDLTLKRYDLTRHQGPSFRYEFANTYHFGYDRYGRVDLFHGR